MDEKRKGEIALLWLKNKMRKEPIVLSLNIRRELGNRAKELGISLEEAMEFSEEIVRELVEEMFAKAHKDSAANESRGIGLDPSPIDNASKNVDVGGPACPWPQD